MSTLVLGAGLTGLSTAYHLGADTVVYEKEAEPGGTCRSISEGGFTFDYTGHLLHLRDERVSRLAQELLPGELAALERRASVVLGGVRTEYPFQANTHGHPPELVAECVVGFAEAWRRGEDAGDGSFKQWVLATFGEGFARHFFLPYNEKFWCRDLEDLTADWVSWAIPRPPLQTIVEGALGVVKRGLGYNPSFLYPRRGGIEILAQSLAKRVPGLRLGVEAVRVELAEHRVHFADGSCVSYDRLVSTLPLTLLLERSDAPDALKRAAAGLEAIGVLNYNLGVDRDSVWPDHWTYFPEPEFPFYRVGVPTNFSSGVAPDGTSSLYVEITYRHQSVPDAERTWPEVRAALERVGILRPDDRLLVVRPLYVPWAYVVFDRHRQRVLPQLLEYLREHDVISVGRYGAWEYSSMEKALLDGLLLASELGSEV